MKKNRLLRLLIATILVCFYSCQKNNIEFIIEEEAQEQTEFNYSKISFNEISEKSKESVTGLKIKTTAELFGKNADLPQEWVINPSDVSRIEIEGILTSYTIGLIGDDQDVFLRNIILSEYSDGSSSTILAEYELDIPIGDVDSNEIDKHIINQSFTEIEDLEEYTPTSRLAKQVSNSTINNNGNLCVEVGYYRKVDKCNGDVGDTSSRCVNTDGTRKKKTIWVQELSDCGSGGSGGSGSGGSGGSNGNGDDPFPDSGGGSGAGSCGSFCGGGTITTVEVNSFTYLTQKLQFDIFSPEVAWLTNDDNFDDVERMAHFLFENTESNTAKERVDDIINGYLEGITLSSFPYLKYPESKATEYREDYPKFTEYLMNQLPKVIDNQSIVNSIKEFTSLTSEEIKGLLSWGAGPEIHIIQLDNIHEGASSDTVGYFDKDTPNRINIDIDWVNELENQISIQSEEDAFLFFLGTTVLHEFVHWGDFNQGFEYPGEEGRLFEIRAYGENVQPDRARVLLDRLNN